ncbi:A/G-specific adenine glycosylase [Blastopirellula marina]|uniref:Adenine DNA glycosylase n=1 Tax=Blastopirellula marina TaxID=124 RepID=A0A2S8FWU7_9BACT|nr:A/G-specific adenine glycosylase [Blastopirellula marina]PQO36633.1 A/G-specific adenine glycosylase [Blastopirellula marina]PTL44463.1 A/G-specific adenine glycosylase [Blastopirellula marina]
MAKSARSQPSKKETSSPVRGSLAAFHAHVSAWFEQHQRDLPWRKSQDPYRVWISEIMLQQTQVATVKEYFRRFTAQLPTVHDLADAEEQEVLRLWEGLGYYRRARQLHAAAKEIVSRFEGKFPREVDEIQSLPGIGRYTAGAIASIAFGQRAPILEANTQRLYARLIGWDETLTTSASQKRLWQFAEDILPSDNVGIFNQALMEVGSLVCTPKNPDCQQCPLSAHCEAYHQGRQVEIPRPKKKIEFIPITEIALVVRKKNQVLVRQCGQDERWAGLWDFPRFALPTDNDSSDLSGVAEQLVEAVGVRADLQQHLTTIKHGVTKYRITLLCHEMTYRQGRLKPQTGPDGQPRVWKWIEVSQLGELPLSTTGRKLGRLLST